MTTSRSRAVAVVITGCLALEACAYDWDTYAIEAAFQTGTSPDSAYDGTTDTFMREAEPMTLFNGRDELEASDATSTLVRWELYGIPEGSVVRAVVVSFFVFNDSGGEPYALFESKRPWVETEATWLQFAAGQAWQVPGSMGPDDRGAETFGAIAPTTFDERYEIHLEPAGVALVQRWIDDPSSNHGFVLADPERNNCNGMGLRSSANFTQSAEHPALRIVYAARD